MIRYVTTHPTAANLLMLIFLIMGLFTFNQLEREPTPDFAPAEVEVRVIYPGATAEEVEEAICQPIEEAIDGTQNVYEIRSEASENVGKVTIEMKPEGNIISFKDEIQTAVNAIDNFPEKAEEAIVTQLGTDEPVLAVLITGIADLYQLKAYAEQLKDKLLLLPEVTQVKVQGFSQEQVQIRLSALALQQHQLSAPMVAQRIANESLDMPAGKIETKEQDILLRFTEEQRKPHELSELVILNQDNGSEVKLGELGTIQYDFSTPEDKIEVDGKRAAKLVIRKGKQDDSLKIAAAIEAFIEKERARIPAQIQLHLTEDGSKGLKNQLKLVILNGLQGMVLVFLTMWLFFSLRISFWVVMGLPVSFLGAIYFMPFLNLSINIFTLIGLLLALGLLMDDAIVIAENIVSHTQKGKYPIQAALDGVKEVKTGVFYSFLTTMGVLGPLSFISGDIGKQLKVVPMILILVMAVSLVEAFMILPAHLGHSMKPDRKEGKFRQRFNEGLAHVREQWVGRTVDWAVKHRYPFVGGTVALLILFVGLFASGRLPFVPLPDLEGDIVHASLLMEPGTPLEETEAVVANMLSALKSVNQEFTPQQPQQQSLVKMVNVLFSQNREAHESGSHVATLVVELLTAEDRNGRIDDYIQVWRSKIGVIPSIRSLVIAEPAFGAAGRPIEVRVSGSDLTQLRAATDDLKGWFRQYDGVINLSDDLNPGKPERKIKLKAGARRFGLSAVDIARQMNSAYLGLTASEYQSGKSSFEVQVLLQDIDQNSLSDLEDFHVRLPSGKMIPLFSLVELSEGQGWSSVHRINRKRTVTIYGDVDVKVSNTDRLFSLLKNKYLKGFYQKFPGVEVNFQGQVKEAGKTRGSMLSSLLFGMVGVFVLLSFQFRSYLEPFVVMAAIPLALIGVFAGHMLLFFPFTMPSLLGFISLSGIVVNDSLLLVEFIKIERRKGVDTLKAVTLASRSRFRAVLLTSVTTIAGLLPMLLEQSLQAQILKGLVISISFGLMASTLLVLFVIPCLYAILSDFGWVEQMEPTHEKMAV